jgi:Na+/phosphate symporter
MKKERTPELLEQLKYLIRHDIIGSIDINLKAGNITQDDARKLKRLTHKLYEHIYAHYKELEEVTDMTDESLMLDIDIIEKEHEKELAKVVAEKDKEIELLKKQLAELSAK